ncbi:MAG: vitamin K epoxide reductase family protein [Solirubrobacteraceae bacterium]
MDRLDRRLLLLIRLFVIPGFLAATYLTYTEVFHKAIVCSGGCDVVTNSQWAKVFGIYVTEIGMVAYITIFASTFIKRDEGKLLGAFVATCGAVFSIFLQYQALIVLQHFCPYCFTSACCMLILCGLNITRLVRIPKVDLGDLDAYDDDEDDDASEPSDAPTTAKV